MEHPAKFRKQFKVLTSTTKDTPWDWNQSYIDSTDEGNSSEGSVSTMQNDTTINQALASDRVP